jgi:hypothetical protein
VVFAEWQNCCSNTGVRRSTSGGPSPTGTSGWVSSDRFGWNTPIVMSPSDHNTLLAGSQYVYRSVNNGVSWAKISGDLSSSPGGSLVYGTITTLDVSKTAPSLYYAGTDDGRVWRTLDGGGLWTNISAGLPTRWVTRVTADPVNSQVVYVTLSGFSSDYQAAMVYRSGDRGNTWTNISGNLPNIPANDLLVDPTDTQRLYLATDLGVWTTRNTGATWYEIGAGLPMTSVADLTLHASARKLFAFTHGRSAWSLDLSALPVSAPESAPAAALRLAVPRPNPARESARIALEMPRAGEAQVVIYDVIGRRVSTLHQGVLAAGRHEFAWTRRDDRGLRAVPATSCAPDERRDAHAATGRRGLIARRALTNLRAPPGDGDARKPPRGCRHSTSFRPLQPRPECCRGFHPLWTGAKSTPPRKYPLKSRSRLLYPPTAKAFDCACPDREVLQRLMRKDPQWPR